MLCTPNFKEENVSKRDVSFADVPNGNCFYETGYIFIKKNLTTCALYTSIFLKLVLNEVNIKKIFISHDSRRGEKILIWYGC